MNRTGCLAVLLALALVVGFVLLVAMFWQGQQP